MEVPHHRWHFQMEVPVDLFCQTRLSERPVSGICFTPLRGTDVTRGRPENFTVPVGQSPLAAVIKIPLLLAFPSHASRSHRTLGFEYRPPKTLEAEATMAFFFLSDGSLRKRAAATATGDPNASVRHAT